MNSNILTSLLYFLASGVRAALRLLPRDGMEAAS